MSEEESSIQENFMTHKNSGDSVQRKIVRQVPDVLLVHRCREKTDEGNANRIISR